MGSVSIVSGHYCSDVIQLAVNISEDYRQGAKSGNNGEKEVVPRRNIAYRLRLGYCSNGHLKFEWLNQNRKNEFVHPVETLKLRWGGGRHLTGWTEQQNKQMARTSYA